MAVATVGSPVSRGSVTGSGSYEVRRGDTLSSIGRQFGLSNQALAQRNNLQAPYALHVGQVLNVGARVPRVVRWWQQPPGCDQHGAQTLATAPAGTTTPFIAQKTIAPASSTAYAQAKEQKPSVPRQHSPGIGRPKGGSLKASPLRNKATRASTFPARRANPFTLRAAAKWSMRAVHCEGYGKLIILKHNDDYLSAYAHNDELRVKEETP